LILLEHERLHFDISEIFAREIRQAVDSLRRKGKSKVDIYSKAVHSWLSVWDEWSDAYDEETSHGLRPSKQKEWAIKIQKDLKALAKYATKCPATNTP
jgi:predicted secreted Zn-dependent protease